MDLDPNRENAPPSPTGPVPGMGTAVAQLRQQLLDIGKRNRLTNAPIGKQRRNQLDIEDERSDEVFKILCQQGKKMTFAPLGSAASAPADQAVDDERIWLPDDGADEEQGLRAHHIDTKLQTRLTPEQLQKRLVALFREAGSLEEEQGISVLFLGMGFLRWYESESSDTERFAPLILLPVDLQRDSAKGRFKLEFRDQDLEPNLSLRAMLASDFDLQLPDFPASDNWLPSEYFEQVGQAVSSQPRWRVEPNTMELSFYSFAKFLMWRDLDPAHSWPEGTGFEGNALIENLLVGGFESASSIFAPDENLDRRFPDPKDLRHILDADTSQTQVIAAASEGKNLVVQGPPGTGKSQTIANIIADAAANGKQVLFVAEKRAALDVVHDRLEKCGLGPLCLELHSHKANKRHVYADLKKTLELGEPKAVNEAEYDRVRNVRDDLNRLSELLHRVDEATGETPHGMIGAIAGLHEKGRRRPSFELAGAESWDRASYGDRLQAVETLAALTAEHGSEATHAWRGARKRLNLIDQEWLVERIPEAKTRLAAACGLLESAARIVGAANAATEAEGKAVAGQLEALDGMPEAVPGLLASQALVDQPDEARAICENVAGLQQLKARLLQDVIENALELTWDEERLAIAQSGKSLLRWFNGRYRSAVARLQSVHRSQLPKDHEARVALLDELLACRRKQRAIEEDSGLGASALGRHWRGERTDTETLLPPLRWIAAQSGQLGSGEAVKRQLDGLPPDIDLADTAKKLRHALGKWANAWHAIANALNLDADSAFGAKSAESVPLADLRARLDTWESNPAAMDDWHRLNSAASRAAELGLDEVRARLADGRLEPEAAPDAFAFAWALAVWQRMGRESPELEAIDGAERAAKVEEFKQFDQRLQTLAAQEISLRHFQSLPAGSAGQVGIVRGEANKKTRHMPIRKLLDKAGEAVAAIKPVFLMSPLSVAQYLRPGGLAFDLALIDEASQVRPADGLGAIMRAKQVVVVGDQKQLPPTSFFDRQVAGDEQSEDYEDVSDIQASQVGDMESILSLCESRAMAGGMLRWHYRSKHPSLIQVSNHEFYDDGLICPPSPDQAGHGAGLSFVKVDGAYDRGRKRNNPKEAAAVAEQVLAHARKHPDETLGVVTLSVAQRDTIRDRLEYMRTEFPELDAFCKEGKHEAFFVKNLENVQGDERDVIFISIGYGKDEGGYMSQSFGPVSSEGGERRLNVLFTRAKKKCRVFSTISHGDIRLDATKHVGPRVLKRYLKYAETGEFDIPTLTGAEMDSPFEEAVAKALQSHGYRVAAQVGSSGFRIDLAVYDPDDEGRFLLAIECDGARYHSSSWARERDRLRQAVLEQKGWRIHRIWSTDWFYRRDAEMQKLLEAIERTRSSEREAAEPGPATQPLPERTETVIERSAEPPNREPSRQPYVEAAFAIPECSYTPLPEAPLERLAEYVIRIVATEGPVHASEVARRLNGLWGNKRLGQRIHARVDEAIRAAAGHGLILLSGNSPEVFLDPPNGAAPVAVRDRSNVESASLRLPEMLPPSELDSAILDAIERNIALEVTDCPPEVARMLGYKSTSSALRERIEQRADQLVATGRLEQRGSELRLRESAKQ